MRVDRIWIGKREQGGRAAMCYSYKDRKIEEEARRKLWEKEERKRREQQKDKERRAAEKERELVRA
jgi:hypothetical protein